jgi:radical SAM protein with 4Fe4S-binding SPASM domain
MSSSKIFPLLREGYVLHKGPEYGFIYSSANKGKCYVINEDAARIIDKCSGKRSLEEISGELALYYHEDPDSLFETVKYYLEGSKLFVDMLSQPKDINFNSTGNWEVPSPMNVSVELTYNCSFSCRHCYINSSPKRDELWKTKELITVLDELNHLGTSKIELTGGDPLTHPDFVYIVKHCACNFNSVNVITNGYLLDEDHVMCLSEYKDKLAFQVDLHGDNSKYVDWFCGREGAFENAKKAIKLLSDNGFKIQVAMNITPLNMDQISNTAALAIELGASSMMTSTVLPVGRGNDPEITFPPENIELRKHLEKQLKSAKDEFNEFLFENHDEIMPVLNKKSENRLNCGAFSEFLCLTPTGNMKMCPLSNSEDISLGCLCNHEMGHLFSKNIFKKLVELEDPRVEICGECEYLWFCRNCLARGFLKYSEIGYKCRWGNTPEVRSILEDIKE